MIRILVGLAAIAALAVACTREPASSAPGATSSGVSPAGAATAQTGQSPAPTAAPPEAAPTGVPEPEYREVEIPAGTVLPVTLETALASDASRREDEVRATLRKDVSVAGVTALSAGASVVGSVTSVERSGRVKGRASLSFRFHTLEVDDERYELRTASIVRVAEATKKQDAAKIGIGAGGGALIGGLAGGKKGAGVGALIGGGAGTGAVLATRGEEVRLEPGTPLSVRLAQPVTVRVPVKR